MKKLFVDNDIIIKKLFVNDIIIRKLFVNANFIIIIKDFIIVISKFIIKATVAIPEKNKIIISIPEILFVL